MFKAAAAAVVLSAAAASPLSAAPAADHGVGPWTEVVVSVADLDESSAWLAEHGGWRTVAEGDLARAELDYWALPETVTAAFRKLCAPDTDTGCIRFVRFEGAGEQRPIRLAARPWDTGGIFSIMLRTEDAQAAFDAAIALGWWAESEPYSFSFGGSDLVNVVIRGPHGVSYALYERRAPPFDAFPVGTLSQAFNTMRMVADQPASLAWYRDGLGFGVLFDAPFTDPEARSNNFSVPANLAMTLIRRAAVAQPVLPQETGRVEVMQFEGFEGRSFAAHAAPPNFGIISVRYPVREAATYRLFIAAQGVTVERAGSAVPIEGLYDRGANNAASFSLFAVRDPDGNITEFFDVP